MLGWGGGERGAFLSFSHRRLYISIVRSKQLYVDAHEPGLGTRRAECYKDQVSTKPFQNIPHMTRCLITVV